MRVLARLRRNRGTVYVADLLLARLTDRFLVPARRQAGLGGAYPTVTERFVERVRSQYLRVDCHDPHAADVLAFVRGRTPDYILLAGAPVLRPSLYGLAGRAALNRHLGLVPDFRGSDCATWAFALDRPDMAGYSIHTVSDRVDGGDVIVRQPYPYATKRRSKTTCDGSGARRQRRLSVSSISSFRASRCRPCHRDVKERTSLRLAGRSGGAQKETTLARSAARDTQAWTPCLPTSTTEQYRGDRQNAIRPTEGVKMWTRMARPGRCTRGACRRRA